MSPDSQKIKKSRNTLNQITPLLRDFSIIISAFISVFLLVSGCLYSADKEAGLELFESCINSQQCKSKRCINGLCCPRYEICCKSDIDCPHSQSCSADNLCYKEERHVDRRNAQKPSNLSIYKANIVERYDDVIIDYTGRFEDGTVFDTTIKKDAEHQKLLINKTIFKPVRITVGGYKFLKAFEENLIGLRKGMAIKFSLSPDETYGKYDKSKIITVPRKFFGNASDKIQPGIFIRDRNGSPGKIIDINGDNVTIDMNHPLAGKTLYFWVKVRDIIKNQASIPSQ